MARRTAHKTCNLCEATCGLLIDVEDNRVGEVEAGLEITDEIMAGVVSLPHGWGHHRAGMRLRLAEAHPGVSRNDLTDDQWLEPVVGNAVLNGVPVRVGRARYRS